MSRTNISKRSFLDLHRGPRETAHFQFIPRSDSQPGKRVITIPGRSEWNTGLHWHEDYVEKVRVVQGSVSISIAGVTRTYGPKDDVLTFPKFTIHGFGRADRGSIAEAEDAIVEEWVDPDDGFKDVFFYNLMGILLDSGSQMDPGTMLQLGALIAYVDEYPVFVAGPFWFKYVVVHAVLKCVSWLGWLLGYQPWLKEYTPLELRAVARRKQHWL